MAKLRKRSKSKATIDKVDRAIQDWYRRNFPGELCECGCGRPFDLVHHHIPKSQSNFLRYNHENLIKLARYCHDLIHFGRGNNVIAGYSIRRGLEWQTRINELAKIRKPYHGKKELEQIIKTYELCPITESKSAASEVLF